MFQLKIDNLHDVMFTLLRFATNKGQVRVERMMGNVERRERTLCAGSAHLEDFVDRGECSSGRNECNGFSEYKRPVWPVQKAGIGGDSKTGDIKKVKNILSTHKTLLLGKSITSLNRLQPEAISSSGFYPTSQSSRTIEPNPCATLLIRNHIRPRLRWNRFNCSTSFTLA